MQKEQKRVAFIQKKTGLTKAREDVLRLRKELGELTLRIDRKSLITRGGALALLNYVSVRIRPDLAEQFREEGFFHCNLARSVERAAAFLAKDVAR